MRLLLVEDSARLRQAVGSGLKKAGYAVDVSADGEEGYWYAQSNRYDVIVLDVMLPKLDGVSLLRRLRAQADDTHVLLLTARDSTADRVSGLQAGADDYLVKPFAFEELLARVQALCRRSYGKKNTAMRIGDLEIDTIAKVVRSKGVAVELTPREYAVLEYLALRRGEVVKRAEIETHIYDDLADPLSNVVDSIICTLRKKIEQPESRRLIQTRRGVGYLLEAAE